MFFLGVILISMLLVIPESRALIDTFTRQAGLSIAANLPAFAIAFVCALVVTVLSWLASLFHRGPESRPYYQLVRTRGRS